MAIHITPESMIRDIQHQFNHHFPFLKIDFFTNHYLQKKAGQQKRTISDEQRIGSVLKQNATGECWITPATTVTDLEKNIHALFDITVQVYRKSGKVWIQTSMTDAWTMKQQNDNGYEISNEIGTM